MYYLPISKKIRCRKGKRKGYSRNFQGKGKKDNNKNSKEGEKRKVTRPEIKYWNVKRQVRQGNELEIESNKHRGKDKNKMEDQGKGLRRYIKVT